MRISVIYFVLICIFILVGCRNHNYKEISYKELPTNVRNKFIEIYDYVEAPKRVNGRLVTYMPPFVECYNVDNKFPCTIKSIGGLIREPYFIINTNNYTAKMSWDILQRVFVVKNDSIYYPFSKTGVTSSGKPRSYNIMIDTLKFRVEKMSRKGWW
jgi:hypothetical protein